MTETSDGDAHILTSQAVMRFLNSRYLFNANSFQKWEFSLGNIWGSAIKSDQICFRAYLGSKSCSKMGNRSRVSRNISVGTTVRSLVSLTTRPLYHWRKTSVAYGLMHLAGRRFGW